MRLLKQAAIFVALSFVTVSALWPAAAFAQEVVATAAVGGLSFTQQLVLALVPIIGLVIGGAVTMATIAFQQKTGIEIDAKHREALQSALTNGVLWALQKAGWMPGQAITPEIMGLARDYVQTSVPGALNAKGIDALSSSGKVVLDKLLTPHLPLPAGTVMPNGDVLVGRAP